MTTIRLVYWATSSSWVTMTMVMPWSLSFWNTPMMSALVRVSRLPVGSSARSREGWLESARAIATRCCWPPESWFGLWSARSPRPTVSSAFKARSRWLVPGQALAGVEHRQFDILQGGGAREQVEALEDEAESSGCGCRPVRRG